MNRIPPAVSFAMQMDIQIIQLRQKIKQLKVLRESQGWSQEYCAHQLGVAYSSLNRWERGESLPKSRVIIQAIDRFVARYARPAAARGRQWN